MSNLPIVQSQFIGYEKMYSSNFSGDEFAIINNSNNYVVSTFFLQLHQKKIFTQEQIECFLHRRRVGDLFVG